MVNKVNVPRCPPQRSIGGLKIRVGGSIPSLPVYCAPRVAALEDRFFGACL
jgi:hypothetical protein